MTSDYAGYSEWKQWDPSQFMVCGPYERRYYKGELGGLELAGRKIVELGFGNGGFMRYAMEEGANVGGTELLAEARARATERGARVYMPDLSDALAENAGNFDLIVAFDVMEHMNSGTTSCFVRHFGGAAEIRRPRLGAIPERPKSAGLRDAKRRLDPSLGAIRASADADSDRQALGVGPRRRSLHGA